MQTHEYDLVVIGSGPAGQKGAICAAKLRKKVAIIDRQRTIGGVCVHTGTIPSKMLREAILYLSGFRQRTFYGRGYVVKDRILMSDLVFRAQSVMPRELIVVGAGIIGLEFASMFATLGVKVTLLDLRPTLLDFVDREIIESLSFQLRQIGTVFRLGEKVVQVGLDQERDQVFAKLESGKLVRGQALLYTIGRQANSDQLNIEATGIQPDVRGKLAVNENFQTTVPHIYAAGDVIGFPALASTSMEQGRLSSSHMFGKPSKMSTHLIPYGIYAIPEISMVGATEEELTRQKAPYEIGLAHYSELAKGQMLGDENGLLKILFDPNTLKLLGVHIIGDRAAEIIHIGQAVLTMGATIEYFRDTVFNYPTLAEAYKVAALDGLNKI